MDYPGMDTGMYELRHRLTALPRWAKRVVMAGGDLAVVPLALWAAFALRLGEAWPAMLAPHWWLLPLLAIASVPAFHFAGLYRSVVRFMGPSAVYAVLKGAALSTVLYVVVVVLLRLEAIPRSTYFLYFVLLVVGLGGIRFAARQYLPAPGTPRRNREPVLIYGAGMAGVQLVTMLEHAGEYLPLFFVDDDPGLQGTELNGLRVVAPERIDELVERHGITEILLAIPSASRPRRREIIASLEHLSAHVRTVPGLGDIISGQARVDELREVDVDDLLGREPIPPDAALIDRRIHGRSVMVTGGGGSIGSELCRQILARDPARLVLLERNESGLYHIDQELRALAAIEGVHTEIVPVLGSVLDEPHLERVLAEQAVETVYHAAAYKHVPLVEANVVAGVRNNVFGTLHAARAAQAARVSTFVLISTDKAVNPTNVMGASKRVAEQIVQAFGADESNGTCFCMVRFGNVLDSSGSVIPLFREQIRRGGPVTVTHPDVIRYFMTIPEASQLVLQAGSMASGGEVFVLDMGQPVRIHELAKRMIRLSGVSVRDDDTPDGDIPIEFTGLRPGEKLYEELLTGQNVTRTDHPMIMSAREDWREWTELGERLGAIESLCRVLDEAGIRRELAGLVSGYEAVPAAEPRMLGGSAHVSKRLH
jgi:FlaA1/EpsC-like NDP-sugar epimerase